MYTSKNARVRKQFDQLSDRVAFWTFVVGGAVGLTSAQWREFIPQTPQTYIGADRQGQLSVRFSGDYTPPFPIEGAVDTVMNLGPGLTGGIQAGALTGHTKTVHFVSGGLGAEFVNRWNKINIQSVRAGLENLRSAGTLQSMLPPTIDAAHAQVPEIVYHRDGIAAAVGKLAAGSSLDIVLMSSVHTAGVEECLAGVQGAAEYLRPGGLLVVKAPDVSLGAESGMDRLADYAAQQLGNPVAQGPCGELQQHIDPSMPVDRPASFAIYQKT